MLLLGCSWAVSGVLLDCSWAAPGLSWAVLGSWAIFPIDFLIKIYEERTTFWSGAAKSSPDAARSRPGAVHVARSRPGAGQEYHYEYFDYYYYYY